MRNKFTSIFGILAGLPQFLATVGITLPPKAQAIVTTVGMVGIGLSAKDWNNHSTQGEVAAATNEAK